MGRKRIYTWTGECSSCHGPSSPYKYQSGLPSWRRVTLADGSTVEVCPKCRNRFARNGTFEPARRGRPPLDDVEGQRLLSEMLKLGLGKLAIARALGLSPGQVQRRCAKLKQATPDLVRA